MAEWNLFHIDQIRPDREPLEREEAEIAVAAKLSRLLRDYGTVIRHVEIPLVDEWDEPIVERYTTLELEAMLQGNSEIFISQLPVINDEIITSRDWLGVSLTDPTGIPALDLIIQRADEAVEIVTRDDLEPKLEDLLEFLDALSFLDADFSETRPKNQYPADPNKYPRLESLTDQLDCPRLRQNNKPRRHAGTRIMFYG